MNIEEIDKQIEELQRKRQSITLEGLDDTISKYNYLFRAGMALRKYHIEELFNTTDLPNLYPDLFENTDNYLIRGTPKLRDQIKTIPRTYPFFKIAAADINRMLKEGEPLNTAKINSLPKGPNGTSQSINAMVAGILKYDDRGYYLDPKVNKEEL